MSDDKVRLWRYARHGARIPEWSDVRGYEGDDGVPYIARPVADDDAREAKLALFDEVNEERTRLLRDGFIADIATARDRDEWKARAERAEREVATLKEREAHFAAALNVADGGQYRNDWDAAIRRVVAERDSARALLREARPILDADGAQDALALRDRIDAEAGGGK